MSRSSLPRHALALGQNKIILDMTNPWLNQANRAAQKEGVEMDPEAVAKQAAVMAAG